MLRKCLPLLSIIGASQADEVKDTEAWIEILTTRYAEAGGYIATYHSEGEDKVLDATVGIDRASGLALVEMKAIKDDKAREARFWNTSDDQIYIDTGETRRVRISGVQSELRFIASFGKIGAGLSAPITALDLSLLPGFLLSDDSIEMGLRITGTSDTGWIRSLKDGEVREVTDDSVTFITKEHGEVTVSRSNGMLTRQSFMRDGEEYRSLELTDVRLDPGRDAIEALSAEWTTLGAADIGAAGLTLAVRPKAFQAIIDAIESGHADLGKLEKKLKDDRAKLRQFADASITRDPKSFSASKAWKKLLQDARDSARKTWLEQMPGADAAGEEAFAVFLRRPDIQEGLRDKLAEGLMEVESMGPGAWERISPELLGKGPPLRSHSETGALAKEMIERALVQAYLEATIDRKMAAWEDRDGLD